MAALWERQNGEGDKAFAAFWAYCVPPKTNSEEEREKRSYVRVAEKLGKSDTMIRRWAKRWNWEERVTAYDNYLLEEQVKELKAERIASAKRHLKIARSFQSSVIKRFTSLKPEELSPKDLIMWFVESVKVERQALGEPSELILQQLTGKDGGAVEIKRGVDLSNLSEEELILLEKVLVKIDGTPSANSAT